MRVFGWSFAAGLTALPLVLSGVASASPAPTTAQDGQCTSVEIPVALAPGEAAAEHVYAEYCRPAGQTAAAVDVLVPGATYNHTYWDWPVDPALYSFAGKDLLAGRAVLAIDPLGTGESSHPVSTDITATAQAYALHQVIAWTRQDQGYDTVNVIGHSIGSMIAAIDAGTWPGDPSALVLTGYLNVSTADQQDLETDSYPAVDDPLFSSSGLDSGYYTTKPGARGTLFYYEGDPSVIAYDEAHKDVISGTELGGAIGSLLAPAGSNVSDSVTAPVLVMVGQEDLLYCEGSGAADCSDPAALTTYEQPYFAKAASLTVETVPHTGHDLALSPTANVSFAGIDAWLGSQAAAGR